MAGDRMSNEIMNKGNVLIVEDDPDTAEVLQKVLSDEGYGVGVVNSRDEALRMLKRYIYDFILLDYWMSGLSIDDFLAGIAQPAHARTKVILMTAAGTAEMIARRLSIDDWLGKPFFPQELIDKLDELSGRVPAHA
jgi:DNA-binding response OmpR family regulator